MFDAQNNSVPIWTLFKCVFRNISAVPTHTQE